MILPSDRYTIKKSIPESFFSSVNYNIHSIDVITYCAYCKINNK